ncbi:hypothetical protein BHU72_05155 [Desulfuribacillus stibiiarsenatis]|uniref:Glycosyltransferase subfamily 4-like N-terminal domain-containing protein n=1 Tax=Desulfuribacillus stibiiarsenatis TaxID=1390249 RepID=A0A1E5L5R3_9FIRM|nr:glycosyltransferase [Desulfuribacillus stibiiarsenatis]OEH85475.1 hypothetical protein BHU72_05155 [Desulfuribacillus stibiiarsenatis]
MTEKKRCKVLHVIGGGEFGGAEQYLINVAKQMKDTDYEIHLACFYDREFARKLRSADIPVHVILPSNRIDFSLAHKIADLIRHYQFDILHTHGVRANLFGRLAGKHINKERRRDGQKKLPVLTTIHSELRQDYSHPIAYSIAYSLERMSQNMTDTFIAISNSIRDDILKRNIPSSKIEVIYNGIDFVELYEKAKEESPELDAVMQGIVGRKTGDSLEEHHGSTPPILMGIVGRLQPVKGHRYAILAMPEILRLYPNARLLIVGEGPLQPELQQLARQLQVDHAVHLIGYQANVAPFLSKLDVFLMPSLAEGLGLSLIEAMAFELPVIASGVGGILDVVQEDTGILVPAEDAYALAKATCQLLANLESAKLMAVRGKEDVQKRFHTDRMISQMVKVYNEQ